jgi:hypothetical protein
MPDEPIKDAVDKPEEVKPVEEAPPSVDPPQAHDDSKGAIEELKNRVQELEAVVQSLTHSAPDSSPVSKPWTHRGMGKR